MLSEVISFGDREIQYILLFSLAVANVATGRVLSGTERASLAQTLARTTASSSTKWFAGVSAVFCAKCVAQKSKNVGSNTGEDVSVSGEDNVALQLMSPLLLLHLIH